MDSKTLRIIHKTILIIIIAGYLLSPTPEGRAAAQTPTPSDDDVNQIARQLFCPVCENVPLDECQIAACDQWRELIREKLGEGWTEDEIKEFFVAQYGDRVVGAPPRRGTHWLLYGLPPVVFLAGLVILLSKLKPKPEIDKAVASGIKDPFLQKVEQDLNNMDDGS